MCTGSARTTTKGPESDVSAEHLQELLTVLDITRAGEDTFTGTHPSRNTNHYQQLKEKRHA